MKLNNFLVALLLLFFSSFSFAKEIAPDCTTYCSDLSLYDPPPGQDCLCNPLREIPNPLNPTSSPRLIELINLLVNFILKFAEGLIAVAILIGGYFILTSAGDEKKVRSGKKIIIISAICLIFVLMLESIKENLIKFLSEIF
jgi:hypothetical protein